MERLIDSFTEGLIEKDQFTSRMARIKARITDLDAQIKASAGNVDQLEHLRLATARLRELAAAVGSELAGADWQRRREMIRTLVRRIDIDTEVIKIIFRVTLNTRRSESDSIAISHCRGPKTVSTVRDAIGSGKHVQRIAASGTTAVLSLLG